MNVRDTPFRSQKIENVNEMECPQRSKMGKEKKMDILKATRQSYGEALAELGEENEDVVVLDADLSGATKTNLFAKKFPDRFFDMGIAENNMIIVYKSIFNICLHFFPLYFINLIIYAIPIIPIKIIYGFIKYIIINKNLKLI